MISDKEMRKRIENMSPQELLKASETFEALFDLVHQHDDNSIANTKKEFSMQGDKRMTYGGNGSHWDGCAEVHWDCRIAQLEAELAALREQVKNLQMSETHKVRVQAVKHMLEQTAFLRRCFALDVFRNYPRLRDEGLRILDGELPDVEGEVTE